MMGLCCKLSKHSMRKLHSTFHVLGDRAVEDALQRSKSTSRKGGCKLLLFSEEAHYARLPFAPRQRDMLPSPCTLPAADCSALMAQGAPDDTASSEEIRALTNRRTSLRRASSPSSLR